MEQQQKRSLGRKGMLGAVLALGGTALAGCDVTPPGGFIGDFLAFGWPKGITPEATAMYNFWSWVWVAAWIIGFVMWGLFIYGMFAWSAKKAKKAGKDEFPRQTQYNIPLELVLTIIPIVIVMALFFFTVQTQDKVTALNKNPEVTVDVTGYQWNWKFGYNRIGAELSPTGSEYNGVDEERQALALASREDENGENPINGRSKSDVSFLNFNTIETVGTTSEIPVLVLPTNTPIEFSLASADVSHAFWVPEFLFKRDVYVNPEANNAERRFQIEGIEREGAFVGRCAEMCGTYHAMMNFEIRAVSPERFADYIQFRYDNPEASNADALASIGEAPYATSTQPFVSNRTATRDGENFVDNNAAS
ncbi:cytochrome c oxidase subunit II [Corynebacterium sp. 153RC1]|uniref:aa3-type cytochrome oxidase subunit II n=1 Tax=unclassified Corynebacterium TaxID=2624378 RepID=UPI00211CA7A2|nr:cytochrome c oxidase subunit II [Corynebacterium sp. 209RC1]MCQ9354332.1 cytochrome c oxidase subunit II [Corynebacterium sp. 1222RC1]MCQ9356614.1 cytochrome c oxidase subunit II [Corynebacterium sp. 122RC1]MCQ9359624.1 cytochrome c oxidase subunit II [Corynebacterium sp. 142RC1]MCQ9360566.1 cytochrome c oxidase subunit II [Corynebacterium sp. 153RC1]MCQ9362572.1 cytochrome c oxidase subunit II [Corynebacterium sp. 732RC1]MCQ9365783.1 cytochrome c oxidase subunit II [Corynebacterium sp. 70